MYTVPSRTACSPPCWSSPLFSGFSRLRFHCRHERSGPPASAAPGSVRFILSPACNSPPPSQVIEKTRARRTPDDCPRHRDAYEISASRCPDLSAAHSSPVLAGNIWNFIPAPRTLPNETEQLCSRRVDEPEIHEELRTTSHTGIKITPERRRGQRSYSSELAERSVAEASLFTRRLRGLNPRKQSAKTRGPCTVCFPTLPGTVR